MNCLLTRQEFNRSLMYEKREVNFDFPFPAPPARLERATL